jgi:hypothetical protein
VKSVALIEVTAEDLDGVAPCVGMDIVVQQVRYRVLHVKPAAPRAPRWARPKRVAPHMWKLLVEKRAAP